MPATPESPHTAETETDTAETDTGDPNTGDTGTGVGGEAGSEPAVEPLEADAGPEPKLNRQERRMARKKGNQNQPGGRLDGKFPARGRYDKVPKQRQFSHRRQG